jgi:hypothetical protein
MILVGYQFNWKNWEEKFHPPCKINFGLGEEKGRSVGKIQLVTIQKPFYHQVRGIRLKYASLNEFD